MPVTNYIWDEVNDTLLMEKDDAGNTTAAYTYEPGQYGPLISQHRNGQTSHYHFDGQGSTRALTDESGTVTDTFTYGAFGESVASSGMTKNPFGYKGALGYYVNPETNDLYVRARHYRPLIARWSSVDPRPIINTQARYVYVSNCPVSWVDPSGTWQIAHSGDASRGSSISPAVRDKLSGSRWRFQWQFGDQFALIQRVTAQGGLTVVTCDGKQHHVSFEETFIEVWTWTFLTNVGPHFERDNHLSRPQGPAQCLEEKTGLSFRTVGDRLFLGERLVEQWTCNVSATFTVVNGDYPNWPRRGDAFYTSANSFSLTALVINNRSVAQSRLLARPSITCSIQV